jgi:hypothetical protein
MGAVNTTYTFTATDTITSTKMNNIIDQTTMTDEAISGSTLEVTSSGKLKVRALGITSNEIANGQVTSDKILDGTIVNADINASAAIDPSKLGSGALPTAITIASANIVDGTIVAGDISNATITAPKLDGAQSGSAPIFGVRAWVNFNGTSGSTAIRQQGNVSSVSRTGTGLYTVNLATPFGDTNYAIVGFARDSGTTPGNYFVSAVSNGTKTTSSFQIRVHSTGGLVDSPEINLMVIR